MNATAKQRNRRPSTFGCCLGFLLSSHCSGCSVYLSDIRPYQNIALSHFMVEASHQSRLMRCRANVLGPVEALQTLSNKHSPTSSQSLRKQLHEAKGWLISAAQHEYQAASINFRWQNTTTGVQSVAVSDFWVLLTERRYELVGSARVRLQTGSFSLIICNDKTNHYTVNKS